MRADNNPIGYRECTTIRWDVDNIDSVYFEGQPVIGHDSRQVCPGETTTYTLLVILLDGSQKSLTITINVGPSVAIKSANRANPTVRVQVTVSASFTSHRKGRKLRPLRLSSSYYFCGILTAQISHQDRKYALAPSCHSAPAHHCCLQRRRLQRAQPADAHANCDLHSHATADRYGDVHADSADRYADADASADRHADDHAVAAAESDAVEYAGTVVRLRDRQFAVARHPLGHASRG